MDRSIGLMRDVGVTVDVVRAVDHVVPPGVQPDMTAHGAERDDCPALQQRVLDADVLVLGTPIWLGDKSSVCTRVVERLYGYSGETNDAGQYLYYGRVGGVVVTGNEDGVKHVAMNVLLPAAPGLHRPRCRPTPGGSARCGRARATATASTTARWPAPTATSPSATSPS
jgi:multimeric flavodoxin WrbA